MKHQEDDDRIYLRGYQDGLAAARLDAFEELDHGTVRASRTVLLRVAKGEDVGPAARALAEGVMGRETVRLARVVQEGGPLAVAAALRLAARVMEARVGAEPVGPRGEKLSPGEGVTFQTGLAARVMEARADGDPFNGLMDGPEMMPGEDG